MVAGKCLGLGWMCGWDGWTAWWVERPRARAMDDDEAVPWPHCLHWPPYRIPSTDELIDPASYSLSLSLDRAAGKVKASELREKNKTELVKQLEELKKELSEVRLCIVLGEAGVGF